MTGQTDPMFPEADTGDVLGFLDTNIVREREIVAQIERELKKHKTALSKLRSSRHVLLHGMKKQRKRVQPVGTPAEKTAAQRAGKANVDAARKVLSKAGMMAKAEIGRRMATVRGVESVNDGTVTYAIRALEEERVARRTGEREHGSDVYEYVSPQRAISRPRR